MSRAPQDDIASIDDDVLDDDEVDNVSHPFQEGNPSSPAHAARRGPRKSAWSEVFAEGDLVARKYYISGPEERTGAVVTAPARHLELEQSVSLTYLVAEASEAAGRVARFLHDVKVVARVPSAHTAKVLDVGRLSSGSPYAALERPEGWTFAEVLRVRGPLPVQEACDYATKAARAIGEAQAAGVRGITLNMENLVLTRASNGAALVKTVLFGASSAGAEEILRADLLRAVDTKAHRSLMPYLAPEHVRHTNAVDESRAAVWALGTILYELIAGKKAIDARTCTGILLAIAADVPPRIGFARPDVPVEVETVIERCLAKEPSARYASVLDVAAALEAITTGESGDRQTLPPRRSTSRIPPPLPSVVPTARAIVRASKPPGDERLAPKTIDRAVTLALGVLLGALLLTSVQALRTTRSSGDVLAAKPIASPQASAAPVAPVPTVAATPPAPPETAPPAPIAPAPTASRPTRIVKSVATTATAATLALNKAASTSASAGASAPKQDASPRVAAESPAPSAAAPSTAEAGPKVDAKQAEPSDDLHATLHAPKAKARDTDLFDDLP